MELQNSIFFNGFGISKHEVVAIIGAGGKTSLMFRIAHEAVNHGMRVLVTTSTRIYVPHPSQYTAIDSSGHLFGDRTISEPGVYVGGALVHGTNKLTGVSDILLNQHTKAFDLVMIEADGAAEKSIKGWKDTEPVVPACTTTTIGVVDIQVIGKKATDQLVHRLDIFSSITGAMRGDSITISHIQQLIRHPEGLWRKAMGEKILFLNKVESPQHLRNARDLARKLGDMRTCFGSIWLSNFNSF